LLVLEPEETIQLSAEGDDHSGVKKDDVTQVSMPEDSVPVAAYAAIFVQTTTQAVIVNGNRLNFIESNNDIPSVAHLCQKKQISLVHFYFTK